MAYVEGLDQLMEADSNDNDNDNNNNNNNDDDNDNVNDNSNSKKIKNNRRSTSTSLEVSQANSNRTWDQASSQSLVSSDSFLNGGKCDLKTGACSRSRSRPRF